MDMFCSENHRNGFQSNDNHNSNGYKSEGRSLKWQRSNSSDSDSLPTRFTSSHHYRQDDPELNQIVDQLYNKVYTFTRPPLGWSLPQDRLLFTSPVFEIPELLKLKDELNEVKNKLNDYDLAEWHQHTRLMNKSKLIMWLLRKEIDPEFVTQAWLKFYEMCSRFPAVCEKAVASGELYSVHLCEAPGAFITSLNHFLHLNHPEIQKWDWLATTLNPYYEGNRLSNMINDDRFILQTLPKWKFGVDNTGDIMNVDNLKHFVGEARKLGPILLVTADGSIDCQDNPGEQEGIVSHLIYCEITTALHILSAGGSFVIKIFTIYEHTMICLLYFLNCCFQTVNVFKPVGSREGNSESYIVCLDYFGTDKMKPWLRVLRSFIKPERPQLTMFPRSILPDMFMEQVIECATLFKVHQVETIEKNIYLFRKDIRKSLDKMKTLQNIVARRFLTTYQLRPLNNEGEEVVGKSKLAKSCQMNMDPRLEVGSFNDRIKKENMKPFDRLKELMKEVDEIDCSWKFRDSDVKFIKFPTQMSTFQVEEGKSVSAIHSSKFCSCRLLSIRNEVLKYGRNVLESVRVETSRDNVTCQEGGVELLGPELTEIIGESCPDVINSPKNLTVISYPKTELQTLGCEIDENLERDSFWNLIGLMEDFWRDKNLVIKNYPMLSHFNVGIIYLLGHMFERVAFVKPYKDNFAVIFYKFRKLDPKMQKLLDQLETKMDEVSEKKSGITVLSVVPIQILANSDTDFYSCVTAVNYHCVKEDISKIVEDILDFSHSNK